MEGYTLFSITLLFTSFTFFPTNSISLDIITPTQSLKDGDTLVSSGERFELGFFSPGNSKSRYVGIWYKQISERTVVWVANRNNPLNDSSGILKLDDYGNVILINQAEDVIWSSNHSSIAKAVNPISQILDSGNFIIQEENDSNSENYIWQSFDYPTDTLLPGMKLGWNLKTGLDRVITSWRSSEDPAQGEFRFKVDYSGSPEIYLLRKKEREYRSGPWNGYRFSGVPEMQPEHLFNFSFVSNSEEVYYSFRVLNGSLLSRLIVDHTGVLERLTWIQAIRSWSLFWYAPKDQCDTYKVCGAYSICDPNNSPVCECMRGFSPENPQAWFLRDGSGGCVRKTGLKCGEGDGFLRLKDVKLPDTSKVFIDENMSLKECEEMCRRNCSCTGYANSGIVGGGSGCIIWVDELVDVRDYTEGGQELFVRVAASDLGTKNGSKIIIGTVVGAASVFVCLSIYLVWKRTLLPNKWKPKTVRRGLPERSQDFLLNGFVIPNKRDYSDERTTDDLELPLFDFGTLVVATNNFSDTNKLGQGGFGCVYKGMLIEGQEIAVKRLSKNSGQGVEEFKNEVKLIARLQHRNLVRLLGCCIEMEEKMLVYEYMPNKSLDSILFRRERSSVLDWRRRFNIICGIARGLLYLHQDSRFRIIHRDLKASNILLDADLNPRISDFGMARIFGSDQTEASTKRVVGTYGYMSPEYAMDGLFSDKSDVFSFGVLVMEIVSGKKNRGFYCADNHLNLLGYAWNLWREQKALELVDSAVGEKYPACEVLRCIQVGLLCVQEHAEDRPTMSTVVLLLSSETASLPQPKNPGFGLGRTSIETDSIWIKPEDESCTANQVTVTTLEPR